jgi:hypothetical protein
VQPAEANTPDDADSDPNRVVYFSQAGRLYRVARPFFCADARACTFRELNAAEVAEPVFGNCEPGTTNCQTSIYSDGRLEHTRRDPSLTAMSGRLWPQNMGVRLRDVPPSGLTFSTDEYNRHKAIYFAIMKLRQFGPNYIEDGILYAPAATTGSGNSSQRGNQDTRGERAVPGQSPGAEPGPSRPRVSDGVRGRVAAIFVQFEPVAGLE